MLKYVSKPGLGKAAAAIIEWNMQRDAVALLPGSDCSASASNPAVCATASAKQVYKHEHAQLSKD
jgi:hypothetical protein